MNRHIVSNTGEVVSSTMPESCLACVKNNVHKGYASIECPLDKKKKRLGVVESTQGVLYACSSDSKTTKLFKNELDSIVATIKNLIKLRESVIEENIDRIKNEEYSRVDRLVHNLKSINAHCIQVLYNCIPQGVMMQNYQRATETAKKIILNNPENTAKAMLRIARNNLSLKAEISVYEKLLKNQPKLQPRNTNLRDVVMIVLYMFFADFTEKSVYVEVENYFEKAYFDFESVQVAIYHIVENAAKYVKPNSVVYVRFGNNKDGHYVIFEMDSIYVYPEEREKVNTEGYSGKIAKKIGKSGNGIGMSRISRLLALNNIMFETEFGDESKEVDSVLYAYNLFAIKNIPFEKDRW